MKRKKALASLLLAALLLAGGCGAEKSPYLPGQAAVVSIEEEAVALAEAPAAALPVTATAVASGKWVKSNEEAAIDFSNYAQGYVMVR